MVQFFLFCRELFTDILQYFVSIFRVFSLLRKWCLRDELISKCNFSRSEDTSTSMMQVWEVALRRINGRAWAKRQSCGTLCTFAYTYITKSWPRSTIVRFFCSNLMWHILKKIHVSCSLAEFKIKTNWSVNIFWEMNALILMSHQEIYYEV